MEVNLINITVINSLNAAPGLFGGFHIAVSCLTGMAAFFISKLRLRDPLKTIETSARIALLAELLKQVYLSNVHHAFQWWYFPFQLCSVPMYLLCFLTHLKKDTQETVCTFCASYTLIAAICALVYPENMLSEQPLLMTHSFLYHGWMIWTSLVCIRYQLYRKNFLPAQRLFCFLALIAEAVNITGYYSHTGYGIPDMFYISPFTPATQPVFRYIAVTIGRIPEIIIYLGTLSAVSFLCLKLWGDPGHE